MIQFLSEEMEEPVIRQYLESAATNATNESSGSCVFFFSFSNFFCCVSFLVSLNCFLRNTTGQRTVAANDIVLFADKATYGA